MNLAPQLQQYPYLAAAMTYLSVAASPGPSNLAIVAMAASRGRRLALYLAAGILTGSAAWAALTLGGLASLLAHWPASLALLKVSGSLYMGWLAWQAWCSSRHPLLLVADASRSAQAVYRQGLQMHLLNPKAMLAWGSVGLLAQPGSAAGSYGSLFLLCLAMAALVFGGYALVFSQPGVRQWLLRYAAAVFRGLCLMFALAAVELMISI